MDQRIKETTILLRLIDGGHAAMISRAGGSPQILRPRPALFTYEGGFAWGYSGTGVLNLAHAILAECLPIEDAPHQAAGLVENLLAHLKKDREYDLQATDILAALRLWPNAMTISAWERGAPGRV